MNTPLPDVLLVEDDLTTAHFFQTVLQPLPARIDWARSCSQALDYAQGKTYDLCLIDLNLPDGSGVELLSRLRELHPAIPALAHTAGLDDATQHVLEHAGFTSILIKPFSAHRLLNAVQRALRLTGTTTQPDDFLTQWDEAAALKALGGQAQHVHSLRQLFLAELPATRDAVHQALAQNDKAAIHAHLHRLKASCGFVGAVQLTKAVHQLQQQPDSTTVRHYFDAAINALLH